MTQDVVKALSDGELVQVIAWAQDEQKEREEKRKHDAIAKIKALANSVGISITIAGTRGRPPKAHGSREDPATCQRA